jgi:hypothetical protein
MHYSDGILQGAEARGMCKIEDNMPQYMKGVLNKAREYTDNSMINPRSKQCLHQFFPLFPVMKLNPCHILLLLISASQNQFP